METTFEDVLELVGRAGLWSVLNGWERRYSYDLKDFVRRFRHRVLYRLLPQQVEQVIAASSHALSDIPKQADIPAIRDAHVEHAIEYLFHDLLEQAGRPPSWDEFWEDVSGPRRGLWYEPLLQSCERAGIEAGMAERSMRWRLGNGWQSAMREVHLLASVWQQFGVPVKYHVLGDVLLRTDGWVDNRLICLRVPNRLEARKRDPAHFFPEPLFRVYRVAIPHQGFGKVWLASQEEIEKVALFLRGANP